MAQRTMSWELCGPIFVIAHNKEDPDDAEYDHALAGYEEHLGVFNGILISSTGGAPNLTQRRKTTDFWKGKDLPPTAIMTSSRMTRGVITAMSWVLPAPKIASMDLHDFDAAFRYLALASEWHEKVRQTVARLREVF